MIEKIKNANIVVFGGGNLCKKLIAYFLSGVFSYQSPKILGVVDSNLTSIGVSFAKSKDIFTCNNYRHIKNKREIDLVILTTHNIDLNQLVLSKDKFNFEIINYREALELINSIKIEKLEQETIENIKKLNSNGEIEEKILKYFKNYSNQIKNLILQETSHFQSIEFKIKEHEKTLFYIIQGSTIPTFIIDRNHFITHWNSAIEKLTGYKALQMLKTRKQWLPFWQKPRHTMADIILDQTDEDEIENLYGDKWKKSDLIEGGYEAELFFPKMGPSGKWLFFTAAPIKSSDGLIIGAIETLWDTTEKKKVESERREYTRKIEEKEKELAEIIQGSTAPTFVINKQHIITHWNYALEKLTGFKARDMLKTKKHWKPFANEAQPIMADVILEQLTNRKKNFNNSTDWRKSRLIEDGYESDGFFSEIGSNGKWLFFTAAPIRSSDNSVVGVIQTFWDVSAAKQAEYERQRYTDELGTLCSIYTALNAPLSLDVRIQNAIEEIREFVNASSLCLYLSDVEGHFNLSYFNSCVFDDKKSSNILSKSDPSIIKQVSKTQKPIVMKHNIDSKKIISNSYLPISAKNKKGFGVMQITKDSGKFSSDDLHLLDLMGNRIGITLENSFLQEELKRKSKFQSKLIRSANDGIIAVDNKWKTVVFNPAAEKMFGYSSSDFLADNDVREFFPKEALKILRKDIFLSTKEEPSPWCDMEITTEDGNFIPVRFSGSILREQDKMIGMVAFFQDLRKIKQLEKELVQSEKLASVGQTVAGMAHCIKNILHGFKGGRYLMDVGTNKNDINKIKNGWGMIQRNIHRTSDLVMDLLSYSKEREPEFELCSPNEIVNDVYELLNSIASEHDIKLIKMYSEEIDKVVLDPKTLHRCMMNLVTNAIDACLFDNEVDKKHFIMLKTRINQNEIIDFIVEDNGCGMNKKVQSKLFSSLFSTKGVKGTGLGLLVTAKLVEEHGGSINVVSREDEGTIFTISLPSNLACIC